MVEQDIGFVGEVTSINARLISTLVESDTIPVIATVAAGEGGQALNINADTAAGEVLAILPDAYANVHHRNVHTLLTIVCVLCHR